MPVPYIVRIRKSDGKVVTLPEEFAEPLPEDLSVISVPFDGVLITVKVERCCEINRLSAPSTVQRITLIHAVEQD